MRVIDEKLATDVVEGLCDRLKAQTAEDRILVKHLGRYLEFKKRPDKQRFYTKLIKFSTNLHLNSSELAQTATVECYAFRFVGVFNDIYSWDRKWKVYQETPTDGAHPFSAIYTLAQDMGLPYLTCKRLLYPYCRELEVMLQRSGEEMGDASDSTLRSDTEIYIKVP
ncbi:hypothetical protein N7495_005345, partial [Penicillium taxi]|uniref:uncharacterized protein n=1 Tax=Penicillium taxi TaxID=168475 RepID=UPI0025458A50